MAVVEIEGGVIAKDVVGGREAELASSEIDGFGRAFEFGEGADGSFIEFDEQAG